MHLIDCPALFDRPQLYSDGPDEHLRYLMLTRAALECCQRLGFAPDIVHCNDWHTAFAPLLLRSTYAWDRRIFGRTKSVFTIHNIGYQGIFGAGGVADLAPGIGREHASPGRPRRRADQPDAARRDVCGRRDDREPDLRARDPHAGSAASVSMRTCARAATPWSAS